MIELPGDLGTSDGCESFMLAVDIAAAGALDAVARAQLERHLAQCENCRDYRERSADIAALVANVTLETNLTPARWQEIETRLMHAATSPWLWIKRTAVTVVTSMVAAFTIHLLAGNIFSARSWAAMTLGFVVVTGGINAYKYRRLRRELAQRDIMAVHRQQLQRMIAAWRTLRWTWSFAALLAVTLCLGEPNLPNATMVVGNLACLVLFWHGVRAARRELTVLS